MRNNRARCLLCGKVEPHVERDAMIYEMWRLHSLTYPQLAARFNLTINRIVQILTAQEFLETLRAQAEQEIKRARTP